MLQGRLEATMAVVVCGLALLANSESGVVEIGVGNPVVNSEVSEASKATMRFEKMARGAMAASKSLEMPHDLASLTTTPLEEAEKRATGETSAARLGASLETKSKPSKKSKKGKLKKKKKKSGPTASRVLRTYGTMTMMDWVSRGKPKPSDKIYEQRAADYAAGLNKPIPEDSQESLLQVSTGATWGRRRRNVPDPGAEQKRPGWQVRYPGIGVKVSMAKFLLKGKPGTTVHRIPDSSPKAKRRARRMAARRPPPESIAPKFVGCYKDGKSSRVLPIAKGAARGGDGIGFRGALGGMHPSTMDPVKCSLLCREHKLMGLQTIGADTFCYCGHSTGKAKTADNEDCNQPCAGNPGNTCGAALRVSVYQVNPARSPCWDGKAKLLGHDTKKSWHRYRACSSCTQPAEPGDKWQQWGNKMEFAHFASCLSCREDDVHVMTDPAKRNGFCRPYNPTVDKMVTYTYPFYAHWDNKPEFVHTKFMKKYAQPKTRHGKAAAVCKLWKQVRCGPRKAAKLRSWQQEFGKSRGMSQPLETQHRFLECSVSKTIKCEKVCVARRDNLGIKPIKPNAFCGPGGMEVLATAKRGLKAELGKEMKGLTGSWCCYNGCRVPPSHGVYKEDPQFWCKDEALSW